MRIGSLYHGSLPQPVLASAGDKTPMTLPSALLTAAHSVDEVPRVFSAGQEPRLDFSQWKLRAYQRDMLAGLERDYRAGRGPWFGLASPMQTGKSYLIAPAIQLLREYLGADAQFIVLSSSKTITAQVVGDLLGGMSPDIVGRFDKESKDIKDVTVASYVSLLRKLAAFPVDRPTVLINDEAYFTQARSFRKIYTYFGVGETVREGRRYRLKPRAGRGLVLGLSGTGSGLAGYHISGQLSLLDAIDEGWIRHMIGERHVPQIQSVRRNTQFEDMIWWPETQASADYLVQVYLDKIHGKYDRPLIFVPKIAHAKLMRDALLRGGLPRKQVHTVYSGAGRDNANQAALGMWDDHGGTLISVRMLSRGFRASRAQAVFHTYQTSSPELFAQRTGRAWAGMPGTQQDDLYVLEVSWNGSASFANLARLLGLVDYPEERFYTRKYANRIRTGLKQKAWAKEKRIRIKRGEVSPLFLEVPSADSWRRSFGQLVEKFESLEALQSETEIPMDVLAAYALGALPLEFDHIRRLRNHLGGIEVAFDQWLEAWCAVAEQRQKGEAVSADPFLRGISELPAAPFTRRDKAQRLDELLSDRFRLADPYNKNLRSLISRIRHKVSVLPWGISDAEILRLIRDTLPLLLRGRPPREDIIFQDCFLRDKPLTQKAVAAKFGVVPARVGQLIQRLEKDFTVLINEYLIIGNHFNARQYVCAVSIKQLKLSTRTKSALLNNDIETLGEVACRDVSELRRMRYMGRQSIKELNDNLDRFDLSFNMDPREVKANYERVGHYVPGIVVVKNREANQRRESEEARKKGLPSRLDEHVKTFVRSVDELNFSVRTDTGLFRLNIKTIGELVCHTESELLNVKYFGRISLQEVKEKLAVLGLSLGMDPKEVADALVRANRRIPPKIKEKLAHG